MSYLLLKLINNQYLITIFRILIGILFIWAAIGKILHPAQFAEAISNYRLLPTVAINFFALTLPWIELIVGIFLLIGFQIKPSSFITICLLIMFTSALAISLIRGLDIDCGCFTGTGARTITTALIQDIILLVMCIHVFFNDNKFLSIEHILKNIKLKNPNKYKMKIRLVST
jgi:uncharacterized membrane protein YphA (DoxX/SURF4 family)